MVSTLATWSILCFIVAVTLFIIEVFIPSGGLIGLMAIIAAMGGIILLFQINTTLGLVGAIVCVVAIPVLMMTGLKLWPNTPVGRWLSLNEPSSRDEDAVDMLSSDDDSNDATLASDRKQPTGKHLLLGQTGIAQTDLRPVGVCRINDHKEPCVAVGGMITAGTPIKVIAIEDNTVKVQSFDV